MTVINTNTAANITANALTKNERAMSQAMERLSTGQRINSAGDDAAGLAISSRMTSQINGLNMAVRNANDAISMVQTEDGALVEVTNMLQRMRELAIQAASGTNSSTDRTALDTEFSALASQIQAIGSNTQWNGTDIIDGTPGASSNGVVAFHVGANASQTVSHTFADIEVANAGTGTAHTAVSRVTSGSTHVEQLAFGGGNGDRGYVTGDTVTFTVDTIVYSGKVTNATGGEIKGLTMHGSSTEVDGSSTDATSIAATSAAGAITLALSADNTITLTSATAGDNLMAAAYVTTFNDGVGSAAKGSVASGLTAGAVYADISTVAGANSALKTIDQIITDVNTARSNSGATINRLEYAADNLANVSQNTSASRSRVLDADYASETTELARTQIIQQAATAMLSQANQQAQSVLALLK